MPRELIIPFLITANYQTSLAIRQLRGELGQLPAELTALRAAAAEVYAMGAMGLFSLGMLAVGAQQLASALVSAQQMAALAAVATGQFAAASAVADEILQQSAVVSRRYGQSLVEITSAFLEAARAGLSIAQTVALLPEAMALAETSGGDLAETVRMVFAILRNMGLPITRQFARTITSELSYALDQSLMDIEDVMHAIKYVGPIAGQLGVPLHDLFAALMLLHDAGIRASIAGTGLARMLIRLEAPTAQARRELAKLGIDWHQLRPSAQELANVIDLLATQADELTIRLLLGERAERAFYAIVKQGTDEFRKHARMLREIGESADYAEKKYEALRQTPAQRFRIATATIRNTMMLMVQPLFQLQLTVAEALASLSQTIADSPLLRAISKMVVGFGSLFGGITLVISALAWLAGRFLELSTIGSHFLMVIDRLQASIGRLSLSALRVPARGFLEGLKALIVPGGLERMATWLSGELRVSELTSAMAQPLIFWRRARRIPPLLQLIPEELTMRSRSIAGLLYRLGIPIERFLFLGLGLGPVRPSLLPFVENFKVYLQSRTESFILEAFRTLDQALIDAIITSIAQQQLTPQELAAISSAVHARLFKIVSGVQFTGNLQEFWAKVQDAIYRGIALQDDLLTATELQMLGFQLTLQDRVRAAQAFLSRFGDIKSTVEEAVKMQLLSQMMRRPEIIEAGRISARASELINRISQLASRVTLGEFLALADSTYDGIKQAIRSADVAAFPYLAEYQRKVQSVIRASNLPAILRTLLMGTVVLPADALTEAMQISLGSIVGLAARRFPRRTDAFMRFFERLTDEISIYFAGVSDLIGAGIRTGLGLASAIQVIPDPTDLQPLIKSISDQLTRLRSRRFLGIATPEEMAQISRLQQQLGMMLGVAAVAEIQGAFTQLRMRTRGGVRRRLNALFNAIKQFSSGGMKELREALLDLGIDMPELIGRLLRDSAAFVRQVEAQLLQMPNADVLIAQFRKLARSVFQSHRALMALFGRRGLLNLHKNLVALGFTEEQASQVIQMLTAGLMQFLAEQAALGKSLDQAIDAAKQLTEPIWFVRVISSLVRVIRNFFASIANFVTSRKFWSSISSGFQSSIAWLRSKLAQSYNSLLWLTHTFLQTLGFYLGGVPAFAAQGFFGYLSRSIRNMLQSISEKLQQAVTPLLNQLSKLPQLAVGFDIARRIRIAGAWQRFARVFAVSFRLWLVGALLALMTDLIPVEEIGQIMGLSERRILQVKGILSFYRRFMLGIVPRTVYGIIEMILIAPIKGLIRRNVIGEIRSAWRRLVDYWKQQWDAWSAEQEMSLRSIKQSIEGATNTLSSAMAGIADTIASQSVQLSGLRNQISQKINELQEMLGAAREFGPLVAPPGIGDEWDRIGELALFYRNALEDLYINLDQFNTVSDRLKAILALGEMMRSPAMEIADAAKELRDLPLEMWETVSRPDKPYIRVRPELENLLLRIGPSVNTILHNFRQIRDQLQSLPPEQRAAFRPMIQWLDSAISTGQKFGNVLDAVFKAPTQYREQFLQAMQDLASVMNADQLKASIFDPIREQLNDLNERLTELRRRAYELLDPREVRERLIALARAQFEALTAPYRVLAEMQQAWSEFMSDLTGDVTRDAVLATENLAAAFDEVLNALSRPAVSPKEALEKLADAFELVGDNAKDIRVNIERLQQLLASENFMATTPEAIAAVRAELAKLGREVLDQLERIRRYRDEVAKLRFEDLEDEIESLQGSFVSLSFAVDRALEAERRYHQSVWREAQLRYRMLIRLGVAPVEAQQRVWDWARAQLRRRPLISPASLEDLQSITSSLVDQFEELGDAYNATVARSELASIALTRHYRYMSAASRIIAGTGRITQQAANYIQKGIEALNQALRTSLDVRVAVSGIGAAFREIREILSEIGTEYLSDLISRVNLMPVLLATGLDRLRRLFTQRLLLSFRRGWDAFVARLRVEREIMNVWRFLFIEPEDLASHLREIADTIGSWIERGQLPSFVAMTMEQARAQFLDLLVWLRQFYATRLQQIGELMAFVPFGTRPWLELLQAQLQVARALDEIEQKLRNIRTELVSLTLYAVPERLSQFLITEGPALWSFMRTGALGGTSTINFTIHVSAQDVSVGVQQALQQAQRTLAGFTFRTIF